MSDFQLLLPRSSRAVPALVASVAIHVLAAGPVIFPPQPPAEQQKVTDQMVVFLVPPDEDIGRQAVGAGLRWSAAPGDGGAVEEPIKKVDKPEEAIDLGRAGEPEAVVDSGPAPVAESALSEVEVDSSVVRDPTSAAPVYPASLLQRNIEGSTFVYYVVDTTGRVDTTTIRVVRTTHPEFADAVREALGFMKFQPAVQASRRVRQWVEQNFAFRITRPIAADTT